MNVESIVNDVKGRVEPIVARGQDVVFSGFEVLKSANGIVVDGFTGVYKANYEAGKTLFGAAQTSFEKVKTDGIKAVASNPVAYLPEGKDTVVSAFNTSVDVFVKTGDDLVETMKQGVETLSAKMKGEPVIVAKAKKTATSARKSAKSTASKVEKKVSKTASKVEKAADDLMG